MSQFDIVTMCNQCCVFRGVIPPALTTFLSNTRLVPSTLWTVFLIVSTDNKLQINEHVTSNVILRLGLCLLLHHTYWYCFLLSKKSNRRNSIHAVEYKYSELDITHSVRCGKSILLSQVHAVLNLLTVDLHSGT